MAVVKNTTPDRLHLFSPDAPPVDPGDEVTISDERFVDRAWPKSTWALVKKPGKEYLDASSEEAHLFTSAVAEAAPAEPTGNVEETTS